MKKEKSSLCIFFNKFYNNEGKPKNFNHIEEGKIPDINFETYCSTNTFDVWVPKEIDAQCVKKLIQESSLKSKIICFMKRQEEPFLQEGFCFTIVSDTKNFVNIVEGIKTLLLDSHWKVGEYLKNKELSKSILQKEYDLWKKGL